MSNLQSDEPESLQHRPFIDGIVYGEGPRWHDGRLWFSDGPAGRLYSVGETGDRRVEAELEHCSGIGWLPTGQTVVSTLLAASVVHFDSAGTATATFDLGDLAWSTNDLVVTPDGRAYIDLYRISDDGPNDAIALMDASGGVRVVAAGLTVPNGLGILPDGSTLVACETMASRLLQFPIESDGTLGTAEVFADLGPQRHPDGLCVDAEGAVWIGCYDSGEFLRVVRGGAVTHRIAVSDGWAVAPALGGADGRTLYLVINDTTLEDLVNGKSVGRIAQARVDVPGIGSP